MDPTDINELPVDLLLNVISRLPTTFDAIMVSPVCQRWLNLWVFKSSINFIQSAYPSRDSAIETARSFAEFINRTLILRSHTPITNFRLLFDFSESRYAPALDIDSWIEYAINHHTLKLELDFLVPLPEPESVTEDGNNEFDGYTFSFSVLAGSHVKILKVRYCKLSFTSNLTGVASRFISLKSIELDTVLLTEEYISNLLLECVNLEILVLDTILGVHDLKICSSSLRKLFIVGLMCDTGSLEIYAPNLECITMISIDLGRYTFKEIGSLVKAYLIMMNWSEVVAQLGNVPHIIVRNP